MPRLASVEVTATLGSVGVSGMQGHVSRAQRLGHRGGRPVGAE